MGHRRCGSIRAAFREQEDFEWGRPRPLSLLRPLNAPLPLPAPAAFALADGGLAGGVARAAGHMNGIRDLVRSIFIGARMPADAIVYEPFLPGFCRARKRWDMAVRYKGHWWRPWSSRARSAALARTSITALRRPSGRRRGPRELRAQRPRLKSDMCKNLAAAVARAAQERPSGCQGRAVGWSAGVWCDNAAGWWLPRWRAWFPAWVGRG